MQEEIGFQSEIIVPVKKTNWDELDFFILKEIYEKEFTGSRTIAKSFFFTPRELEKREINHRVDSKEMVVLYRLRRLARLGLIEIKKTNERGRIENSYNLLSKKILIQRRKYPDCYGKEILLKVNGKWEAFQL